MNQTSFKSKAILLTIVSVFYMFFYAGLQVDHLNILTPFLKDVYGWDDMQIINPVTMASVVTIILYLVVGAAFVKFGIRKILVPSVFLMALGCAGIAISDGEYSIYAASIFIVRTMVVPLQLGTFMLCANWFIKYRGRALGIITAGSPFFSIVGIGAMTAMMGQMGLNVYFVVALVLVILALLSLFGIQDTPEGAGLNPDGADHKPFSETHENLTKLSFKDVLLEGRAWQLIISYGILQFVIVAMMSYMAVRYISLGTEADVPNLFVSKALGWLSLGAAAGIPMSYVIGWIDDKMGSIKASLVLNILFAFAVVPLAIMPVGGNDVLMAIWAFGVACMTGGLPTMHPCITSYVYGRHHYMEANKWIMTVQAIPMAFAVAFMGWFNQAGNLTNAYYILLGLLVVSFLTILSMKNIKDANEADRDYA